MSRQKNPRLKKANTPTEYTQEQVQELIKCSSDPKHFINNYVYIRHPLKGQILFKMYGYQEELVDHYEGNRYSIVLSARQTGKTETTCAYLLWYAIFNPDKLVFVVSNKSSNAMEMIGKIQNAYEELPDWLKPGIDDSSWNKHECKFDNKSRIISQTTSEDSGRGYAISLLYCDELAFVKNHIQEEFWDSIYPTLSCLKGNTLVLTDSGYRRIEDMFFPNDTIGELYDFDNNDELYSHLGMCKPSKKYISPASETLKLTTAHGRVIELTPHHPLMTLTSDGEELRRADSLNEDDYIRVDYNMNCFGDISPPENEAYILGKSTNQKNESCEIIPSIVLMYDERATYEFLGGLFDSNSSITNEGITYISPSHQLVLEIQIMLNNIGIMSIIDSPVVDSWCLNIPLSQIGLCIEKINLRIQDNKDKLTELAHNLQLDDSLKFTIPADKIKSLLLRFVSESGKSEKWFKENGATLDNCLGDVPNNVEQSLLGNLLNLTGDFNLPVSSYVYNILERLHNPNICWEKIKTIEVSYCEKTYDFTVPDSSTFLQNGIMGSNTGGSCIISSTPNGSVNLFAKLWQKAKALSGEFKGFYVPWDAPPDRDERFKQDKIDTLGKLKWEQEYECKFLSSDGTLIDTSILEEHDERIEELEPTFVKDEQVFWRRIHQDKTYLVGCDPATGSGADFSVITVFEFPAMVQVMEFRDNTMNSNLLYAELKKILLFLETYGGEVYFSVENNGVGEGLISLYEADETQPESSFLSEEAKGKLGFRTTNASKIKTCLKFKEMFEGGQITVNSEMFMTEIKSFTRQGNTFKAQVGATDDCICAFLIIIRVLEEMTLYDDAAFAKLYGFQEAKPWVSDENDIDDNPMPFIF